MSRRYGIGLMTAACCLLASQSSFAYEFEVNAQTVGQGRTLRALGLGSNTALLKRRRMTQSLQLYLWDLAGTRDAFARWDPTPDRGPRYYFASYLRLDQEQGNFVNGQLLLDGRLRDIVDVIPELERSSLQLDLLYGYLGAEGLLGGTVDVFVGRQMDVQTLDWFSMDGVKVRGHLPVPAYLEVFAGMRVRDNSWGATDAFAPDGTSTAGCEEFVEADAAGGSGAWRPIDGLPTRDNNAFTSDDEICPQREQSMPTVGFALAIEGSEHLSGRISYRRSHSASPGVIGEVDRLDFADRGYYPFEKDVAASGINEERVAITLRGHLRPGDDLRLTPFVAGRYSMLHGIIDEAHVGAKLSGLAHSLESELFYSAPTFDGDSIFNIFSSEPYSDARVTWRFAPRDGAWSGYARGWGRRYHSEDSEQVMVSSEQSSNAYAGGGHGGLRYRRATAEVRLDSFAEDGYGGQRIGGLLAGRWRVATDVLLHSRLSLIRYADDSRTSLRGTNSGVQLGVRHEVNRGFATSLILEQNSSAYDRFALAAFAMIDLAFQPKT